MKKLYCLSFGSSMELTHTRSVCVNPRPYRSVSSRRRPLQDITRVYPIDKIADITPIPSTNRPKPRPPCTYSGRAGNACTNLLGLFVRCVRTRGMAKAMGSAKLLISTISPCRTRLPRMARATNSCTPPVVARRTARVLLADFCRAFRQ